MLTQTRPWPPPAAGAAALVLVLTGAAEGELPAELFGLNKSPSVNLPGDAEGLAAGLAAVSAVAFFRARFGFGDTAGDSAVDGDAACSAGEAAASVFLCVRCFFAVDGDSPGVGD